MQGALLGGVGGLLSVHWSQTTPPPPPRPFSVIDADANTSNEDPLFDEPTLTACPNDFLADNHDDEESKYAMVFKDAAVGRNLWKRCHFSAHFPSSMFDVSSIVDAIRFTFNFPTNPRYEVDEEVLERCQEGGSRGAF
jgi:hypothetical protein